ncbi:hypothetical protein GUJ93_ZPchr0002g24513 [Zizania palustris]|uniref:Uncharacterized protein n=1 Tax=Zizania palustris TaxID=103762 RepID=A0A8J5RME4_ZIZPA|nr:hypothetical protein GUJ93_ZPchr0002g24513 [Zizania palustris]
MGRFPGEGLIPAASLRLVADHPSCYDVAGGQGGDWGKSVAEKCRAVRPPGGGEAGRGRGGEARGGVESTATKRRAATRRRRRGGRQPSVGKNLGGGLGRERGRRPGVGKNLGGGLWKK